MDAATYLIWKTAKMAESLRMRIHKQMNVFRLRKVLSRRTATKSKNDGPTNKIGRPGRRAMLFV